MYNLPHNYEKDLFSARLLIVDDELSNVLLLEDILEQAGYRNIHSTTDSRATERLCYELQPDIILLDLMMPHMDGFQIMEQLSGEYSRHQFVPILVLTADITPQSKRRALAGGAQDFLTKPFDQEEVLLRIQNLLAMRFMNEQLQRQNQDLEIRVQQRTRELENSHNALEKSQFEILERLARAAEYRDDDTGQHTQRVGRACALLAERLGLPAEQVELIRRAAPLHDVGKIGIPDSILLKPGRLTDEEREVMKWHAAIGASLLAGGHSALVQMAERIARTHHERWDGSGYPHCLPGEKIPLEGRIAAVVDVFDALIHERPYKKAWPIEDALDEIQRQRGTQFDPRVVDAFLEVWPMLVEDVCLMKLDDDFPVALQPASLQAVLAN